MDVFPAASGGGEAMAKAFNVPFLGRLPLDEKMTKSCEEGVSFLEEYPDSVAASAFSQIVQGMLCVHAFQLFVYCSEMLEANQDTLCCRCDQLCGEEVDLVCLRNPPQM